MDTVAQILSIIGCLNWGLVGIFQFDLVAWLFGGAGSLFSRLVYTIYRSGRALVHLLPVPQKRHGGRRVRPSDAPAINAANRSTLTG